MIKIEAISKLKKDEREEWLKRVVKVKDEWEKWKISSPNAKESECDMKWKELLKNNHIC